MCAEKKDSLRESDINAVANKFSLILELHEKAMKDSFVKIMGDAWQRIATHLVHEMNNKIIDLENDHVRQTDVKVAKLDILMLKVDNLVLRLQNEKLLEEQKN